MARLAVIVSLITVSLVLVGCNGKEGSKPQVATEPNAPPSSADALYAEARTLEEKAGPLRVVRDKDLLKMALNKYNELIDKYPTSNKISDAAYRMGNIYEYLGDYPNAVKNYQRAYQWNPETPTLARFKAAYVLDTKLGRRTEALQIYQEALAKSGSSSEHIVWVEYAQKRVKELTGEVKPPQE